MGERRTERVHVWAASRDERDPPARWKTRPCTRATRAHASSSIEGASPFALLLFEGFHRAVPVVEPRSPALRKTPTLEHQVMWLTLSHHTSQESSSAVVERRSRPSAPTRTSRPACPRSFPASPTGSSPSVVPSTASQRFVSSPFPPFSPHSTNSNQLRPTRSSPKRSSRTPSPRSPPRPTLPPLRPPRPRSVSSSLTS